MIEISITGATFYAYHGVHPEERLTGNFFSLEVKVGLPYQKISNDKLVNTLDYGKLYNYCAEVMKQPVDLLETIAENIIEKTFTQHNSVAWVEVSVAKHNPPVGGPCDKAIVKIRREKLAR